MPALITSPVLLRQSMLAVSVLGWLTLSLSGCGSGGDSTEVTPVNTSVNIPVANSDQFTVAENSSVSGSVAANDIKSAGGVNEWKRATSVSNGTLVFNSQGLFTYTPNVDYYGSDSFTYYIEDGRGGVSETVTVLFSVNAANLIADPLIEHQWYLENRGQPAFAMEGGVATADVNLRFAGSSSYAQGFTGAGVKIAIIDSDLQIEHEDLLPNVLADASYNFFTGNGKGQHDPTAPNNLLDPEYYHGTAVAGLAAAKGGNGVGIWGVAPAASLVGYNLLYDRFSLTAELAALGYADAVKNYPGLYSQDVDVFNMSYGRTPYQGTNEYANVTPETVAALKSGTKTLRAGKGAIYVKAAGNDYYGGTQFTEGECQQAEKNGVTCYNVNMEGENVTPYQMVIGGFNADDKRASYSSTGSALWLVAPVGEFGVEKPAIMTTDASGCINGLSQNQSTADYLGQRPFNSSFNTGQAGTGNERCNYFSAFNGSSSSTPIVSGIAALLLEANPHLSWRDVKHILATTARKLDSGPEGLADNVKQIAGSSVLIEAGWRTNRAGYAYSNAYGFGAPNADAAISMALDWKMANKTLPPFRETAWLNGDLPADRTIPNYDSTGLSATVLVSNQWMIESVELTISIDDLAGVATDRANNKIAMADYQIVLRSPQGTESVLLTPFNVYEPGHDMLDLKLISHAFYGETSGGKWTLIVRDLDGEKSDRINHIGEGKLTKWSLKVYGREGDSR